MVFYRTAGLKRWLESRLKSSTALQSAVFAGLGDWVFRGADKLADKGNTPEHVNAITAKINVSTRSYKERRDAFLITKEIFKWEKK